ncbi:LytTR family DNA-binding domain-containing protein [Hymenobacter sp. H14-R3]|uniref:LytR/AlgR family response regulator transcription factor n=1 Tax=Hymenobacter sp. H14-R3 TaxID=3046308 RepID=UPI0024BA6458|nr:LytTR family DNA-binding domain-containing protein [Hymenobacter sp. H14-R3]MDJ0364661.1 LytTR family DNA-binding domain-containing protein [Hymenobacter sp. H14-R3]
MPITCIAVDDEPLALALLCTFIEQTPFLRLVGRYGSGVEALQGLHELTEKIEVAFLDIQMQELTGLELARVLGQQAAPPRIVFTTAFPQYALEGYKVDALDYLVKPFNYEEFLRAAHKARVYAELTHASAEAAAPAAEEEHIFLKVEYQLVRVALGDILYVEGLKDYVKVHLKSTPRALLSLMSLRAMEEKLPARRFLRIHRSFIVSLDKIEAVRRLTVQIGTETIPVGEQYKEAFTQFLSRWS